MRSIAGAIIIAVGTVLCVAASPMSPDARAGFLLLSIAEMLFGVGVIVADFKTQRPRD